METISPEDSLKNMLGLEDSKDEAFRLNAPKRQQRLWKLMRGLEVAEVIKHCAKYAHDRDGLMLNLPGPNGYKPLWLALIRMPSKLF